MRKSKFFNPVEAAAIRQAVAEAESRTSGEIRVYVESFCKENVLDRAAWRFSQLGMQKTRERTGVLIYLAVNSRKMAVIGDAGINAKVPVGFWDAVRDVIIGRLKEGQMCLGLVEGVRKVGELMQAHFPRSADDRNELSDDVVCGD